MAVQSIASSQTTLPILRSAAVILMGGILAIAAAGCSRHAAPSLTAAASGEQSAAADPDEMDPCSLLDPKEVEAALGAPLATPPFRTAPAGDTCEYEDAHFHHILVQVDWDGATVAWKLLGNVQAMVNQGPTKGMLHLADGSDIAGTWDEARVVTCCTFATLMGDQGVSIDVSGSRLTIPQAAKLADSALKRLSKPLSIDGVGGIKAASQFAAAHRPRPRDACSLMTRAEVEAIIGPLIATPTGDRSSCEFDLAGTGGMRVIYQVSIDWNDGFSDFRQNTAMEGNFAKGFAATLGGPRQDAMRTDVEQLLSPRAVSGGGSPPWEAAHEGLRGLAAVRDDIEVRVGGNGPKEKAVLLLQQLMSRI